MLRACSANLHPQNCTCMTESPRTANPLPPANFSPRESIDRRAGAANTPQRIDRTFPGRELLSAGIGQQTRRRSQNSTTSRPGVPRTRTPLRGESVNRRAGAAKTPHQADRAFHGRRTTELLWLVLSAGIGQLTRLLRQNYPGDSTGLSQAFPGRQTAELFSAENRDQHTSRLRQNS